MLVYAFHINISRNLGSEHMRLGKHVSIAGGIVKALDRAVEIGCNAVQIFASNPRSWKAKDLDFDTVKSFITGRNELDIDPVVVHAIYLINIASPGEEVRKKSLQALKTDYRRSVKIGADFLVFHPGSHTGSGIESGIKRIAAGINEVLAEIPGGTWLLLENVAGAGTQLGASFAELNTIIKQLEEPERVGVCLDTCHSYSAGYNLTGKEGLDRLLAEFAEAGPGLDKLKILHINDSLYELGSNKDEHAHIGEGKIGREGFYQIVNRKEFKNLPLILETPWFDDRDDDPDVDLIKSLRQEEKI